VDDLPDGPLVGYLEGYYGRLLRPEDRRALLRTLESNAMSAWWYAPKDDARHRLHWREPYDARWRRDFRTFAQSARQHRVALLAGMAPGLDFRFADLPSGPDFARLLDKSRTLLDDGATVPTLLLDDIEADFAGRAGDFASEGVAHATLANELGAALGHALVVVPRIYANELHARAPDYLPDLVRTLAPEHALALCGNDVVAATVHDDDCRRHLGTSEHRIVVWDNLYANDYCPRRLFVGPWTGRDTLADVMINPTGLPATDALLIDLVGAERERQARIVLPFNDPVRDPPHDEAHVPGDDSETGSGLGPGDEAASVRAAWRQVLDEHGVPAAFDAIAGCFDHPVTNAGSRSLDPSPSLEIALPALDELTWRWKSALAREWFPWLMGLRHDLLLEAGTLPEDRIAKTQSGALARRLLGG